MFAKTLVLSLITATSVLGFTATGTSAGEIAAAEDGKRKINISGRQRMLSQRMAKAVCFSSIGVDVLGHVKMAKGAHADFEKALVGLREGDADLGILKEEAPAILTELDGVVELWSTYGETISSAVSTAYITDEMLSRVSSLSVPTLVQMNKAVGEFEKRYGASDLHPSLALAINVSGRQRMLSQKSSKEFCLTIAESDKEKNREALVATVNLFETSLAALMNGDEAKGLPEAPTEEIYEQLELVNTLWTPVAKIFSIVIDGGTPTQADIAYVAKQNNIILVEMNKAVGMYASL